MVPPHDEDASAAELLLDCTKPSDYARRTAELRRAAGGAEALAETERALAAIGAAVAPVRPPDGLRARLLASMGRGGRLGVFTDRIARLFDVPVDVAAKLLAKVEGGTGWKPWFDGIDMLPVRPGPRYEGAVAAFGRLRAGARFPHHAHVGDELTVVLEGGFRNEDDRSEVWRGEELWKPAGSDHDFVVLEGHDCIAAVLAIGGVTFG